MLQIILQGVAEVCIHGSFAKETYNFKEPTLRCIHASDHDCSIHSSVYTSSYLSLSFFPSISLSFFSIYPSFYQSTIYGMSAVYMLQIMTSPSVYLHIHRSTYLFIYLSIYQSLSLSILYRTCVIYMIVYIHECDSYT